MGADNQTIFELLKVHADLRRNGCSRMEAWEFTRQKAIEHVDMDGMKKLHTFVTEWEKGEGCKLATHSNRNSPDPLRRSDGIRPIGAPLDNEIQSSMKSLHHEPDGARIAGENSSSTEIHEEDNLTTPGYFPPENRLLLFIKNQPSPLMYGLAEDQELIVGRYVPESPIRPDVDLGRFGGEKHGVSRVHASINRHGTTLVITDLGSRNFTLVNGLRLRPKQVRVLNHNDEVYFGTFQVRVKFYRAS